MYTVKDVLQATQQTHKTVWRNKNRVTFRPTSVKVWKDDDGVEVKTIKGRGRDSEGSGKSHRMEMEFHNWRKKQNSFVVLSCDCLYFQYYCDYALHEEGSSELKWSTDQAPDITNPSMVPLACKHLIKALWVRVYDTQGK